MNVHFEPRSGNLRLFKNGGFGDRYDWSCRVDIVSGVAHLSLVQEMMPGVRAALVIWGRQNDISEFRWVRFKDGKSKTVRYLIPVDWDDEMETLLPE